MNEYELRPLREDGTYLDAVAGSYESEQAAIMAAKSMNSTDIHSCEVWIGTRFIGRFTCARDPSRDDADLGD